jgi:tRNA dimethylallyltransferase
MRDHLLTSRQAILIAGPTASGKSALALSLAKRMNGAVINADSMQIYQDLHILTARPSEEEEAQAPHLLYGHCDGAVNYSVGHYMTMAQDALATCHANGWLPIFVGGTGLYFKALVEGLSPVPPVPDAVRISVRLDAEGKETPLLHEKLALCDPAYAARLRPTDRLRIMRGLEVWQATGRSLLDYQTILQPGPLADYSSRKISVTFDVEALRQRINKRFHQMIEKGALQEVEALAKRGLDPFLPVMRAHGVPALIRHIRGEMSLEEAMEQGMADTRSYAKRQRTWARNQMTDWERVDGGEAL